MVPKGWSDKTPPKGKQRINLTAQPPDPTTFDGPLNLFIALHGVAVANINAAHTKQEYDEINSTGGAPAKPSG
jgi:hypothetical protein